MKLLVEHGVQDVVSRSLHLYLLSMSYVDTPTVMLIGWCRVEQGPG